MSLPRLVLLSVVCATLAGCTRAPPASTEAPQQWSAATAKGEQAMAALQQTLLARLQAAMAEGGPSQAIAVCRDEAQALTEQVEKELGVALGRTSHRLRNPTNAPRPWVSPLLASAAGQKVAQVSPQTVDLGHSLGMVRPIGTLAFCTQCHGPREQIPAEVATVLSAAYPEDEAVGFEEGDFRGFVWVEVTK
jgi:hypothetical protein